MTTTTQPTFALRRNARLPKGVTPAMVGREIEAERSDKGVCSPRALVNRERPAEAPLHECFEWDDERAAEEYRVDQARALVRSLVIVRDHTQAPAYVHVNITAAEADDGEEREGYVDVLSAMRNPRQRRQVLMEALEQLNGMRQRYADFQELTPVWTAVEQVQTEQGVTPP